MHPSFDADLERDGVRTYEPSPEDYQALDPPAPRPQGRPSWDDYFLGMAFLASQRSPDKSTKHGCVIVHQDTRHVIGMGYNGFPPGSDDEALQATREIKYANVIHSEVNAIANCSIHPRRLAGSLTAYVTGECCGDCAEHLAEHGVLHWVMADRRGFSTPNPESRAKFDRVVLERGVSVHRMKPSLDWMVSADFLNDLRSHGFLP